MDRTFLNKRINALRLGVRITRSSTFRMPEAIRLNGRRVPLAFPDEHGVATAFSEIFLADVYGLRRHTNVRTVLDIGAHIGLFSVAAAHVHPRARIHAYEPNRSLSRYLDANAALAGQRFTTRRRAPSRDRRRSWRVRRVRTTA